MAKSMISLTEKNATRLGWITILVICVASGIWKGYGIYEKWALVPRGRIINATLYMNLQKNACQQLVPIELALSFEDTDVCLDIGRDLAGIDANDLFESTGENPGPHVSLGESPRCHIVTETGTYVLYVEKNALEIIDAPADENDAMYFFYSRKYPRLYGQSSRLTKAIVNAVHNDRKVLDQIRTIVAAKKLRDREIEERLRENSNEHQE
jgi:hypothetical protein